LRRLDPTIARRILEAITRFAETEYGDVIRLRGTDNEFRLRVGDWRVRFQISDTSEVMEIVRVLPRGRAYRD
jgi:mRNA interferase RelE/StbE